MPVPSRLLTSCLLAGLLAVGMAEASDIQLQMTLNVSGSGKSFYLPWQGEVGFGQLAADWVTAPEKFFIAAQGQGLLQGIASYIGQPAYARAAKDGNNVHITLSQALENNGMLLVFAKGDWRNLEARMPAILSGKFFQLANPLVGYSGSQAALVTLALSYANLDLLGAELLGKGNHIIAVENQGSDGNRTRVRITRDG
ncbi:MAG: hypothetical protein HY519_03645 [Candidatus Aenigmarchaeota archaeon]|nr:hypothetical protein [Candidatus Aenigmarchaeota archaeon]